METKTTGKPCQTYHYSQGKWHGYPIPTLEEIAQRAIKDFGKAFIKLGNKDGNN